MSSVVPNNQFKEFTTLARQSVESIRSLTPVLFHANTEYESIILGPNNRSGSANYFKQGRSSFVNSLSSSFEQIIDRIGTVTINQEGSASLAVTDQQVLFDIRKGWEKYLKPKVAELGTGIHDNVVDNFRTKCGRWYGSTSGGSVINTYFQLMNAAVRMRLYGTTGGMAKGFIPASIVPYIIQSGLSDFAMRRGNEDSFKWELSNQYNVDWYECTSLANQLAGTVGNGNLTLTVVSTSTDSNGGVNQIVFSGAPTSDANAIHAFDKIQFKDGVSGQPNMRMLAFVGHTQIDHPVQCIATQGAASDGSGLVSVNIYPSLQPLPGQLANINNQIVPGMQVSVMGDHSCGLLMQGNPLMLAMAPLPSKDPFRSVTATDPDTKASLRLTYASKPFDPEEGWAYNALWGSDIDDDNAIGLVFPPISSSI